MAQVWDDSDLAFGSAGTVSAQLWQENGGGSVGLAASVHVCVCACLCTRVSVASCALVENGSNYSGFTAYCVGGKQSCSCSVSHYGNEQP